MPTAREVRNRIRSVKNIAQITRALEAVSASRVRSAQARAFASRVFAEKAWEILLNVQSASTGGAPLHPLLTKRDDINTVMIVLVTSDRGLAGAFNSNIIRAARIFARRLGKPVQFVTVGRKGRDALIRAGENVVAEFSNLPSNPSIADITPISRLAINAFLSGDVDDVYIAYTDFINMLTQRPAVLGWLPLIPHTIEDQVAAEFVKDVPAVTAGGSVYEYEPNAEAILQEIVPRFTALQLYQAILESQASEHAARMVAMRNATDNASQLTDDLTLIYNKARQAAITGEILDIVGGAQALEQSLDKLAKQIEQAMARKSGANGKNGRQPAKSAPEKPKASKSTAKPKSSKKSDDLKKIEGIGPKIAKALTDAGIDTYSKLAQASEKKLTDALDAAGVRLAPSLPTWSEQASFAAKDDWDGLSALQDKLVAGRKTK